MIIVSMVVIAGIHNVAATTLLLPPIAARIIISCRQAVITLVNRWHEKRRRRK
jgi:hypothetical protein